MNKYIQNPDIIIIGAGAAGLLAAITAAKAGLKTIVLEKMQRPARKLRITGKGRCNITNSAPLYEFLPHFGANSDFLQPAFNNFFAPDIMRLLEKAGVELVTERGGRVFPTSGKAAQVVDALVYAAESAGAKIICNHPVRNLIINNNIITGVQCAAETFHAPNIILATGGKSYPATGSDGDGYRLARQAGHTIIPPLPALVPLVSSDPVIPKLNGLNLRNVRAKLFANDIQIDEQFGEMTFAEYGLTGPIILTASGIAVQHLHTGEKMKICIDLKPALSPQKLSNRLQRDLQKRAREPMSSILRGLLPRQLIRPALRACKIQPHRGGSSIGENERQRLLHWLKNFTLSIDNHRPWSEAIITAGGVDTNEISSTTMQSKITAGLYITGELLDIQADTGGYNLQAAFSTAYTALQAIISQ